ncbi:MAG: dTMP kinase [Euryarchaeota archaeon]|nr:dTMP kinase [Euryarchaeota archaeon]
MNVKAQFRGETISSAIPADARKGAFIVFEGIDGSGKSTAAKKVFDTLTAEGRECELTAEPSGSWLGDAVRNANEIGTDDLAEALLFMADRAEHTRQIKGWVEEGKVVICDRYYASTLAYQTALLERRLDDPMSWLWSINEAIILRPDVTFFFHIDPKVSLERLNVRNGRSKFEKLDYLRKVDENYQRVEAMDPSFVRIDASRTSEAVLIDVLSRIRQNL